MLSSALGHFGYTEKAQTAVKETLRIKPDLHNNHLREILPFRCLKHFEFIMEGLKKADIETKITSIQN